MQLDGKDQDCQNRKIELGRALADEESARLVVILTECPDGSLHRSRVERRRREIPNWY